MLERANQTLSDARTLHGRVTTWTINRGRPVGSPIAVELWAAKPGSFRMQPVVVAKATASTSDPSDSPDSTSRSGNGAIAEYINAILQTSGGVHYYSPSGNLVARRGRDTATALDTSDFTNDLAETGIAPFFGRSSSRVGSWTSGRLTELLLRSVRRGGVEEWNGARYVLVDWTYENVFSLPNDTVVYTTRFFIGDDHLVHRSLTTASSGYVIDRHYELELGRPQSDTLFAPRARSGLVVRATPSPQAGSLVGTRWLALDSGASLVNSAATPAALLTGHRATMLWLWASGCSSCIEEFPIAEQWRRAYERRGVAIVALAYGPGDEENARATAEFNGAAMPFLFGAPSWYSTLMRRGASVVILDRHGRVAYHGLFARPAILAVLDTLAGS